MPQDLVLYSYWRSSAAYRVRIALNLKELPYRIVPVHLTAGGGEQHLAEYDALNPQHLVPVLKDGERVLRQSLAIMEYLDECAGDRPPLLPSGPRERVRVRAIAQAIACDIHPIANLRVMQYLENTLGADADARLAWSRHWIATGFDAVEAMLARHPDTGAFCHGDHPGMADACLVPQVYNARRWELPLERWPTIARIEAHALEFEAFRTARPEAQPDAPRGT